MTLMKRQRKGQKPGGGGGSGGSGTFPIGKIPIQDDDGTRLAYPPLDGEMQWPEKHTCGTKQIKHPTQAFSFDPSDNCHLSFIQDIKKDHTHDGQDVHVSGNVVVRRAGNGTPGPSITLEIISNDEQVSLDLNWHQKEQLLYILTPRTVPWPNNSNSNNAATSPSSSSSSTPPCLQIRATIWLPRGSNLDSLAIRTVHLGVDLLDNLSLRLADVMSLSSVAGNIVAGTDGTADPKRLVRGAAPSTFSLDSRHIEVKTVSGSIVGAFPLYDYLGLQTVSGSVRAGVRPKEALRGQVRPAVLWVHTTSGTIEVHEPVEDAAAAAADLVVRGNTIPPRQYDVDLYTMSGTVRGSLAFGSSCKVHTTSGNIDLNLLPVLDRSQASSFSGGGARSVLDTSTTSGTTVINVMDALWGDVQTGSYAIAAAAAEAQAQTQEAASSSRAIRALDSRHSTTSAPIRVTYPSSWEGTIEADSLSGRLDVSGRGVEIIRREEEFPGFKKHILARKGQEGDGGALSCHTTSGSISVLVGS